MIIDSQCLFMPASRGKGSTREGPGSSQVTCKESSTAPASQEARGSDGDQRPEEHRRRHGSRGAEPQGLPHGPGRQEDRCYTNRIPCSVDPVYHTGTKVGNASTVATYHLVLVLVI